MTLVDIHVSLDSTNGLKMYQTYPRSQMRKHFNDDVQEDMPRRSRPALDKLDTADNCELSKYVASIRSPLSPRSIQSARRLSQVASVLTLTTSASSKDINTAKQEENTFGPIKELFVSPHPDDICYSCFSTVAQGKEEDYQNGNVEGERIIVTVFSKSRCANGEIGERLKRSVDDVSRVRRSEDEQFAEMVGCKLLSLDQPDSSARDEYSRWTHLADQDVEEQHRVVKSHSHYLETIKALSPIVRWAVQCKAAIYMPLGIGCHIDHLLTRVAVTCILDEIKAEEKVERLPSKLTYYEDLPYAFYVTEQSIQDLAKTVLPSNAKSSLIAVDQDCWEKKQQAVLTYATQMKPIILPALHERAITLAGLEKDSLSESSILKERIWTI